jgi:hypothetical protein
MGQVDVAIQSLQHAYGPRREHPSIFRIAVEAGRRERRLLDPHDGRDARQAPTPFSIR